MSPKPSKPGKPAKAKPVGGTKPAGRTKAPAQKRYGFNPLDEAPREPPKAGEAIMPAPERTQVVPGRVDLVALVTVEPDPWQGRRPLPEPIRSRFHAGEIDAEQAVREWVQLAETDSTAQARLAEYRVLAKSLSAHEQINPSSVVRVGPTPQGIRYRIESGERRYWATWLNVVENGAKDRTLKVIVRDAFSARRQAEENSTQLALGAVELARTVARTLLEALKITPENAPLAHLAPGSDAFYRLALEPAEQLLGPAHKHFPRNIWPVVEQTMGRQRSMLEKLLRVLALPDAVLEIADAYALPERVLRVVLAATLTPERQVEVVTAAGQYGLGQRHVQQLCEAADFSVELDRIRQEVGMDESVDETRAQVPGAEKSGPKPRRATPAKRSPGEQFADRLGGLRKSVAGLAKGQNITEAEAVGELVSDALRVRPSEARDWLTILVPLVERLRQLSTDGENRG